MLYNPKFMIAQNDNHRLGIICHELWHMILRHVGSSHFRDRAERRGILDPEQVMKIWNIAMDLEVNSLVTSNGKHRDMLPKECLIPGEGYFVKYPFGLTAEEYFEMIIKDAQDPESEIGKAVKNSPRGQVRLPIPSAKKKGEKGGKGEKQEGAGGDPGEDGEPGEGGGEPGDGEGDGDGEGEGEGSGQPKGKGQGHGYGNESGDAQAEPGDPGSFYDSHDGWVSNNEDLDEADGHLAEEMMNQTLREVEQELRERGVKWGSMSERFQGAVLERIATKKIDWARKIRFFGNRVMVERKRNTITRPDRRGIKGVPGQIKKYEARILVAVDVSGSMSDELLGLLYDQINKLAKEREVDVVQFDWAVFEDTLTTWSNRSKNKVVRNGCGGTSFQPPMDFAIERGYDGLIMVTDMCAPAPQRGRIQRLWCTDEHGERYDDQCDVSGNEVVVTVERA
jgi:predicted metal-dependent peptidase